MTSLHPTNPPPDALPPDLPPNKPLPEAEALWKTGDVAKFLRVSSKTVFELRKKGLPYLKLGGAVRFIPAEVKDYLVRSRRLSAHQLRQIARKGAHL